MTKQSERLREQNKINTQVALKLIANIRDEDVYRTDARKLLIKQLKKEVPNEKYGEGIGSFYYFDKDEVIKFANKLKSKEVK